MKKLLVSLVLAAVAVVASAARPVARWDVVPHQRVKGVFKAGVVGFHEKGVRVEFSVNGKRAFEASAPTLNERTGVWEFVFPLDVAKLPEGPVKLGATAIAPGEPPYALPELPLYADAKENLGSRKTVTVGPGESLKDAIAQVGDGGTVYLKAGEYATGGLGGGKNRSYWTTLAAAPGVKREEVQVAGGRSGTDKIRYRGLTLFCDAEGKYASVLGGENGATCCWLDDCVVMNRKGRWACNAQVFGNRMVGYVTGGLTTEMNNGPGCTLQRNHEVRKIASDVWTGSDCLVVNCRASDVDPGTTGAHPDFHQSYARAPGFVHDVILYNVKGWDCKCQGLFGVRLRDSAFVNVSFERVPDACFYSQYSDEMINVIFAHITLVNQPWLWRQGKKGKDGDYAPTDVRVFNCVFLSMGGFEGLNTDGSNGLLVHHNAFYGTDRKGRTVAPYGLNGLQISRSFADEAKKDFSLKAGSPALAGGVALQCVPADINGKPYPKSGSRPCGAYAK